MGASSRILIVDDHPGVRRGLRSALEGFGHADVVEAAEAESALRMALEQPPDLIIVDLQMPGRNGLELIADLQERGIETTAIVLTGHGSIESAIDAMRRGVFEYIEKPVRSERLKPVVDRALERTAMRRELQQLRREMIRSGRLQEMVGSSPGMVEIYRLIEQVAPTTASVLILGESGTGKEVIARTLHRLSPRAGRAMVAINCAAIPGTLLETELFGHEKGAFTGATAPRSGCFEQADGGTLFLDEIGDMPADLQSKLLRALEERKVRRVGGTSEIPVDVRVVSATNAEIDALLADGRLREDLYFRLNVFTVKIPPLRERIEDIPILAEHFLRLDAPEASRIVGFSDAALRLLVQHAWPGNVRELRNAVQRASILCPEGEIQPEHLPPDLRAPSRAIRSSADGVFVRTGTSLEQAERDIILATLQACGGNKPQTAETLGISLRTLYTRLHSYEGGGKESEPS